MKKSFALILVVCLLAPITVAQCDNDAKATPFECGLTSSIVEDTALKIIVSDTQRALLTVCLMLDFGLAAESDYMGNNFGELIINDSYVASDGSMVVVSAYAGGKMLNLFYHPETKEALYSLLDMDLSNELMDFMVQSAAEQLTFHYKNDAADLMQVVNMIKEVTQGNK